jgi:hypothetical protein
MTGRLRTGMRLAAKRRIRGFGSGRNGSMWITRGRRAEEIKGDMPGELLGGGLREKESIGLCRNLGVMNGLDRGISGCLLMRRITLPEMNSKSQSSKPCVLMLEFLG